MKFSFQLNFLTMNDIKYMEYVNTRNEDSHSPDILENKKFLKVNDIISFKFEKLEKKDPLFYKKIPRSISTYGYISIPPKEDKKWRIIKIANSIPNKKGNFYYKDYNNYNPRFIMVEPFDETYNSDYQVFWFIDEENLTIRQFEDGNVIQKLNCIQDHI